jgi:hypothetical protein
MFIAEIDESHFPPILLKLKNASELADALRTSAIRSSLKLPMTVVFMRQHEKIISTYFFGGSSTAQIVIVDTRNLAINEVEEFRPASEMTIDEISDSSPIHGHIENLSIVQRPCTPLTGHSGDVNTEPDISENDGVEIASATTIKVAPVDEDKPPPIRRKSLLARIGRQILKFGRRLFVVV